MGAIYKISCKTTGKVYIGQTVQKRHIRRWYDHVAKAKSGLDTHLACAIRKYGVEDFVFQVLMVVDDKSKLNELERLYVIEYRSNDPQLGYNMTDGGDTSITSISEEVRMKMSAAAKRRVRRSVSEETRHKIRLSKLGIPRSSETKRKISETKRGQAIDEHHRQKIKDGANRSKKFKLSILEVQEIKHRLLKETNAELALAFKVSNKMIWRIRNNKYYRSLDIE